MPDVGLTSSEARRRLDEYGPNRLERVDREPLALRFVRELTHLFAIVLWVAAALAFVAGASDPASGMHLLGWAVVGVILVNGTFSFWQEYRADRALRMLEDLLPRKVTVLRDATLATVDATELVPGDHVVLEAGDRVPADAQLVEARGLMVDTSTLTGEAVPVAHEVGNGAGPADALVFAGTVVASGRARCTVVATGAHTRFARIARLAQGTVGVATPLQLEIRRLSRTITIVALVLGVVFAAIGRLRGLDWTAAGLFGIGLIVANVPEGLLPTVTLSLALAAQRMARRNALVRHLPAVDALGAATVICTDKTGTLTMNKMRVERWYEPSGATHVAGSPDLEVVDDRLFACALACHDLRELLVEGAQRLVGDPMEIALVEAARAARPRLEPPPRTGEIPFDTRRKRLTTVHELVGHRVSFVKGALEAVLPLATSLVVRGERRSLDDAARAQLERAEADLASQGLRVLALAVQEGSSASAPDDLERELQLLGLVALRDPPRAEVPRAMQQCHEAGVRVVMITGDHPSTAAAIAREIGLVRGDQPLVLTGAQVGRMNDVSLQLALDAPEVVLSRMSPEDKTRVVLALQRKGDVVAVTGDGVNDAPALRAADVGVAMGRSGSDVAREVADMVLLDDNFATIVAAIEEGRAVFANVRKFLTYILTSNVPELVPYLAYVLLDVPLPLTVMQILAVDLGTDMLPALALAAEPPAEHLMKEPPRKRGERLLSTATLLRAYVLLGLFEAAAAMTAFFWVLYRGGWTWGTALPATDPLYRSATTACLAGIVVSQIVNVFACKSDRAVLGLRRLLANRLVFVGIAVELLLMAAIAYTPLGHRIFASAPIDAGAWLVGLPFALTMFAVDALRRSIARARAERRAAS